MFTINPTAAFIGFTLLLALVKAEIIILANCQSSSGSWSSQIAYYKDWATGQPDSVAKISAASGGTATWEGREVSATFADGNTFTSHIRSGDIGEYRYAGPGENAWSAYACWKRWEPKYTMDGGGQCYQAYWCDKNLPQDQTRIDVLTSKNSVEMQGDIDFRWLMWIVSQRVGQTTCNDEWWDVAGSGCRIQFTCHEDVPGTNGRLSETLQLMGKDAGVVTAAAVKRSETVCVQYRTIEHGIKECVRYETRIAGTTVPKTIRLWAVNVPADGSREYGIGEMAYEIQCPAAEAAADCGMCIGTGAALSLLGLIPEVGIIWGGIAILVGLGCRQLGCS